ncbi:unnamed protein product [Vicia faba]|uniref:Uncharacterized protein n=1 Tax=Vicia faba TaxID=3906 RepID=A0AAV0YHV7_VICFA|nr:unnamed protein product [Vicia faba]
MILWFFPYLGGYEYVVHDLFSLVAVTIFNVQQYISATKTRDHRAKEKGQNPDADSFSMFSGRAFTSEKDMEELNTLKEQIGYLQLKLKEKEELLKSADAKLDEMKHQVLEKGGSLKYTQQQLSDVKISKLPLKK